MPVRIKSYISPSMVLLAYDWAQDGDHAGFAGFAIERTPGLGGAAKSWLSDMQGGLTRKGYSCDPWADASPQSGHFHYRIVPVIGPANAPRYLDHEAGEISVRLPHDAFTSPAVSAEATAPRG